MKNRFHSTIIKNAVFVYSIIFYYIASNVTYETNLFEYKTVNKSKIVKFKFFKTNNLKKQ